MVRNKEIFQKILQNKQFFFLTSNIDQEVKKLLLEKYDNNAFLALFPMESEKKEITESVKKRALEADFNMYFEGRPSLREHFEKIGKYHNEYVEEIYDHLEQDKETIGKELLGGRIPEEVISVSASGADSHNHSRQTMVIETDAGKFIYKPHSVRTDELIKEFCDAYLSDTFYIPKAIDRGNYGYCEFVETRQPEGEEELRAYFANMGYFCAFAYFLCISDQHYENFIARGPQPVPVDLETPMTFFMTGDSDSQYSGSFLKAYNDSIHHTIMLAYAGEYFIGGLLCSPKNELLRLNEGTPALKCTRQILDGFSKGYGICLAHKDKIAELMNALGRVPQRLVIRNTSDYCQLISQVFNVRLWDMEDRFERLHKAMVSTAKYPEVGEAEYQALSNCDIPYFYITAGSTALFDPSGVVKPDYFSETMLEKCLRKLSQTSEYDKAFQLRLLKKSLDIIPEFSDYSKEINREEYGLSVQSVLPMKAAKGQAAVILEGLYDDAVRTEEGKIGFLIQEYGTTTHTPMGAGMATGYSGVGVFAAACLHLGIGDAKKAKELVDTALDEIECFINRGEHLKETDEWFKREESMGLASGIGGILRGLQLIRRYTKDERAGKLQDRAFSFIDSIDLSKIDAYNVYAGLSGLLIACTHSYEGPDRAGCINKIADRILELSFTDEKGIRNWKNEKKVSSITGYGKGIGGAGLALLKAWEAVGEQRYYEAAKDAIAFEDGCYSEEKGFWPHTELAIGRRKSFPGICSGAPGLTFLMMEGKKQGIPLADKNLERVRECVRRFGIADKDNLCCGNMAIIESLVALGESEQAGKRLSSCIVRKKMAGQFIHGVAARKPYFGASMFYGATGAGYELLRYVDSDEIESLFE